MKYHSLIVFFLSTLLFTNPSISSAQSNPQALVPDIQISRILTVRDGSIRVARNPVDGQLYYTDTQGNIYVVIRPTSGAAYDSLVYTTADHSVEYVQGFAIYDSTFYVSGNNGSTTPLTTGIISRGKLQANGSRIWSNLMTTEPYKTADYFDHLFSGMTVKPGGDSLLICSGARGDHGEIQTRYGLYPGVRNAPLTARIFILPTNDVNPILLLNDSNWLDNSPYAFANGIRNTFDMAFDADGNLFGVENSGDRDHNEEMNWLRKGHHYGFPWKMGDTYNPQQFPWFDPAADSLIPHYSRSWRNGFWSNDPTFPPLPSGLVLDTPIQNFGPDCDKFRDTLNGNVLDASDLGVSIGTFTAHRSPLGLVFDSGNILHPDYRGDGFMLSWTEGLDSCGCTSTPDTSIGPFLDPSQDLVHLDLNYDSTVQNFTLHATRIVADFEHPVDDDMYGNTIYVLENGYGGTSGLFEITLPYPPDCTPTVDVLVPNICTPTSNSIVIDTFGIVPDQVEVYRLNGTLIFNTTLTSTSVTLLNLDPGSYYALVHDNGLCSDSINIFIPDSVHLDSITVYPASCSTCNDGGAVPHASGGLTPYLYSITPPGTISPIDSFPQLTPDVYYICVTDINGCMSCDSATITSPTSVSNMKYDDLLIVRPNPANETVKVNTSRIKSNQFKICIRDTNGKLVYETLQSNNNSAQAEVTIPLNSIQSGIYYIEMITGSKIYHQKLVVQK
ncbi:MAG: T9SS type A sorting domain-containing protein [Bacteroidia bacterium]